jgi:superfamily I DNA/RNA helicase
MRRVARLVETGAQLDRILVCTFTRTAAEDLQKEVLKLGEEDAASIKACTIHSYCFELLSKAEAIELTGRKPRPILDFETRFLQEDLKQLELVGLSPIKRLNN